MVFRKFPKIPPDPPPPKRLPKALVIKPPIPEEVLLVPVLLPGFKRLVRLPKRLLKGFVVEEPEPEPEPPPKRLLRGLLVVLPLLVEPLPEEDPLPLELPPPSTLLRFPIIPLLLEEEEEEEDPPFALPAVLLEEAVLEEDAELEELQEEPLVGLEMGGTGPPTGRLNRAGGVEPAPLPLALPPSW